MIRVKKYRFFRPRVYHCVWIILLWVSPVRSQQLLGLVLDNEAAPIAQVQIFNQIGTKLGESGLDGYFRLNLRPGSYKLVFNHPDYADYRLSYVAKDEKNDTLSIMLQRTTPRVEPVEITSKWKDPGPKMMRKAIARRKVWGTRIPAQSAEVYIKAFERIENPERYMRANFDSREEKKVNADLIKANMAEIHLHRDWAPPNKIKEYRKGVSIRGDKSSLFYLSTTEGDFNIYQNLMSLPALSPLPILSPLSNNAILAYRFQFVESYQHPTHGRVLRIKFRGRQVSNATFSGEIHLVDTSFYASRIELNIPPHLMAEYYSMRLIQNYRINQDSLIFIDSQRFVYENKAGSIRYYGETKVQYDSVKINPKFQRRHFGLELSRTEQEAYERDTSYWNKVRVQPLLAIEKKFVNQSDSIKRVRTSDRYLDSLETITNKVSFRSLVLEGQEFRDRRKGIDMAFQPLWLFYQPWWPGGGRLLFANRIKKTFDSKREIQLLPNLSYGILNKDLRGSVALNTLYDPYKRKRVFIQAGRDFGLINPFAAYIDLFRRDNFYQHNHLTVYHRQEIVNGLFLRITGEISDRQSIADFEFSPSGDSLFENNTPTDFNSHLAIFGRIRLSYTPFQKYISEPKQKIILGSKWPTFSVEYKRAIPNLFGSTIDYDYLEYRIEHAFPWGTAGNSEIRATSGSFMGRNNVSLIDYRYQRRGDDFLFTPPMYAFQTLDSTFNTFNRYYEVHYRHHFNGALINKIPFMKYFQMYESIGANLLYAPERRNLFFVEAYAGVDKLIKLWRERFKIGLYYCIGYSNLFEQPRSFFKINFEFYNRSKNSW